ncbi:MAG: hypothetical protein ACLTBV_14980 [Enterocloster bolteae]
MPRLVVGKGAWAWEQKKGVRSTEPCCRVFPAGCAVVAADSVEEVERGSVAAIWNAGDSVDHAGSEGFGPLSVSVDTYGRNLFEQNKGEIQ